jgi:diguanylate cyclase (GGDEF)-like protein
MKKKIRSLYYKFRFYNLGVRDYKKCFDQAFYENLYSLIYVNAIFFATGVAFLIYEILFDEHILGITLGLVAASIMLPVSIIKYNQSQNGKKIKTSTIYILVTLTYLYCASFCIYEGIWAKQDMPAVLGVIFLMCALLIFMLPAFYVSGFILTTVAVFLVSTISVKSPEIWPHDVINILISGAVGLVFTWFVMKLRMSSAYSTDKLKEERRLYFYQSTLDELTLLKNRRDFTQTFQRMLTNSRWDDDILCVALLDVDCFKEFNDFYGHSKGDECLRSVGKLFLNLQKNMSIYVARVGGEEFACLWFEKERFNIEEVANKIIDMVHDLHIPHEKSSVAPYVTASIGVYATQKDTSTEIDTLYQLADEALYKAKKKGRNRAVVSF